MFDKIMKWSNNGPQPSGLSQEIIQKVSDFCKERFECPLPQGYADFLSKMNGFWHDGYSVFCCYNNDIKNNFPNYSSLDLVTFNIKFYDNTDITDYIILGHSCIDYIGYEKGTGKYVLMSNGTMTHFGEFDTFEELLTKFLDIS